MADMNEMKEELKKLRDELELKMHLASLEMKQEWKELEEKMDSFSSRARLETTRAGVGDALERLGGEIKLGYQRIRAALKD
jgi:uncharacterized protein YhaN